MRAIDFVREYLHTYYHTLYNKTQKNVLPYLDQLAEKAYEIVDTEDKKIVQDAIKKIREELGFRR